MRTWWTWIRHECKADTSVRPWLWAQEESSACWVVSPIFGQTQCRRLIFVCLFFGVERSRLLKGSLVYWLRKILPRALRVRAQCVPSCFCSELFPVQWMLVSHHINKHFWQFCSCSGKKKHVVRGKVMLWIRNWDQYHDQWRILVARFLNYLETTWKGAKGWSDNICRVYKENCKLNQISISIARATPDQLS